MKFPHCSHSPPPWSRRTTWTIGLSVLWAGTLAPAKIANGQPRFAYANTNGTAVEWRNNYTGELVTLTQAGPVFSATTNGISYIVTTQGGIPNRFFSNAAGVDQDKGVFGLDPTQPFAPYSSEDYSAAYLICFTAGMLFGLWTLGRFMNEWLPK